MEPVQYPLARALVFAVAAAVVGVLSFVSIQARSDERGWKSIKASPMHWTALLGSVSLAGFMAYIWLFVGSKRPDAADQMRVLFSLIVAFGSGALAMGVVVYSLTRRSVRWRGHTISFAVAGGREKRTFHDIVTLKPTFLGDVKVAFRDGATVRLNPYATGGRELIEAITAHLTPPDRS